jgi:hypothetical protein
MRAQVPLFIPGEAKKWMKAKYVEALLCDAQGDEQWKDTLKSAITVVSGSLPSDTRNHHAETLL